MSDLQIKIALRDPDGNTIASIDTPVDRGRGWRVYHAAVHLLTQPEGIITFPEPLSAEEAEKWRRQFAESYGRHT